MNTFGLLARWRWRVSSTSLLKSSPALDTFSRPRQTRGFNSSGWRFIQDVIDDLQRHQTSVQEAISKVNEDMSKEQKQIQEEISKVNEEISMAQKQIDYVQQSLVILDKQILDANENKQLLDKENKLLDDKKQLRDEKKQLRDEKNKLLDEKNKLLDDKKQLRDEKNKLRDEFLDKEKQLFDKEKQLFDKENELFDEINKSNFLKESRLWNSKDVIRGKPEIIPLLQDFGQFRTIENSYLVDKTAVILKMLSKEHRRVLFRRPRRFGKSLTLSTLKYFFFGATGLFKGLEAYNMDIKILNFRWSPSNENHDFPPCPVLSFDFSSPLVKTPADFRKEVIGQILREATACGLVNFEIASDEAIDFALERLIERVSALRWNRWSGAVILVDEYDAVFRNCKKDKDLQGVQIMITAFFQKIKAMDKNIVYCFVTGIESYGFAGIYSGANNFVDLTYEPAVESLCGNTEEETSTLLQQFGLLPSENSNFLQELRRQYNGYSFDLAPRDVRKTLFNPFFIAKYAKERKFKDFWGDSASGSITNSFPKGIDSLPVDVSVKDLQTPVAKMYDSESANLVDTARAMLETGYGTITNVSNENIATIDFPNVQMKELLASDFVKKFIIKGNSDAYDATVAALKKEDLATFFRYLNKSQESLPYVHAASAASESSWLRIVHNAFYYIGLEFSAETPSGLGRSDIAAVIGQNVYILEFKVINCPETKVEKEALTSAINALKQIVNKKYDTSHFVRRCVDKSPGGLRHVAVVINVEKSRRRIEYVSVVSSQGEKIADEYL